LGSGLGSRYRGRDDRITSAAAKSRATRNEECRFLLSTECDCYVAVIHDFFATIASSVDSEVKALPATSEYNSSTLKPFSSNSFLSESLL